MRQPNDLSYTSDPPLLYRVIYAFAAWLIRRKLRRHLSWFRGVGHVPLDGPLILVANHESYFDNFVICGLLRELLGRRVYVPTKLKAFKGRLRRWLHEALGGVAVDHADPEDAYRKIGALLERGECVLIFPEGKRSEQSGLLPFRYGGFNLSAKYDVPIVPVALLGTGRVLPKGRLRFVANERAAVHFGSSLRPQLFRADNAHNSEIARRLCSFAHDFIASSLAAEARPEPEQEAEQLARVAEARIEVLLDGGVESITARKARAVTRACELAFELGVHCLKLEVQYARAFGFWVLAQPLVLAVCFLQRYLRLLRLGLAKDPKHPYLHYCFGQYYLRAPRLLGGARERAVEEFQAAYEAATAYDVEPAKFAVSYASELVYSGRRFDALALLVRHFSSALPPGASARLKQRRARVRALVDGMGTPFDAIHAYQTETIQSQS